MAKVAVRLALVASFLTLGSPTAFALLCAADDVPAATLLFPFMTAKYAAEATPTNPVADWRGPLSLFSVTNVSSTARIVHFVLYNDFGLPILDWDVLLGGYQTYQNNLSEILGGYLGAQSRGAPFAEPIPPWGAIVTFGTYGPMSDELHLPGGQHAGSAATQPGDLYHLCTNPDVTPQGPTSISRNYQRLPEYLRAHIFHAMRRSQVLAEQERWWDNRPEGNGTPEWLMNRTTEDNVVGFITADVVAACGGGGPWEGADYFETYARPVSASPYRGDPAFGTVVGMGNSLIGDWMVIDSLGATADRAVAIEIDNQDVADAPGFGRDLGEGGSFYRMGGPGCVPGEFLGEPAGCEDDSDPESSPLDYTRASPLSFGNWSGRRPSGDRREPLPSAFGFRWIRLSSSYSTRLRIWKEASDVELWGDRASTYGAVGYSYYSFDESGRVWTGTHCPVLCAQFTDPNVVPLAVQEISRDHFNLPNADPSSESGWILLAFAGSSGTLHPIPGGFADPVLASTDVQAWVEVIYDIEDRGIAATRAAILGNYLCDRHAVAAQPRNGRDRTDLGNVFY